MFFRGQDGSVQFQAGPVAQISGWTLTVDLEELDTTVMEDAWKTLLGGVASWRGTVQFKLDAALAGQEAMLDELITAAPSGTPQAVQLRVSATKYFSGNALLRNVQIQNTLGSVVTMSAELAGSGALTRTWA